MILSAQRPSHHTTPRELQHHGLNIPTLEQTYDLSVITWRSIDRSHHAALTSAEYCPRSTNPTSMPMPMPMPMPMLMLMLMLMLMHVSWPLPIALHLTGVVLYQRHPHHPHHRCCRRHQPRLPSSLTDSSASSFSSVATQQSPQRSVPSSTPPVIENTEHNQDPPFSNYHDTNFDWLDSDNHPMMFTFFFPLMRSKYPVH